MRILAVDDDRMILELLDTAMSITGNYEIHPARSGEQALEILAGDGPAFDCFLLDIKMPGIDGAALCRCIREMPKYKRTPIIMATAMSQKSHIDRAFVAGASDYIMKPFDFTELETRIETACRVAASRARAERGNLSFESLQDTLNDSLAHSLEEPFEVGKVEAMIGYMAFQNYLLTLSITRLLKTSVQATKIANIEQVYSLATPIEFRGIIAKVGQLISTVLKGETSIFTYWGNGTFLSLHQDSDKARLAGFEGRIQAVVADLAQREGWVKSDDMMPRVVVGPPVSMKLLNKSSTLKRAINRVEKRCVRAREVGHVFEQAVGPFSRGERGVARQRENYADILRDYLREDMTQLRGRI